MTIIKARLVALTQPTIELQAGSPEGLLAYCARVSNPSQQDKPLGSLLNYCVKNKHWSIFEMANAVVEVEAPRDITRQLLRHRSFSFQELSQRYAEVQNFTKREWREQDTKNRQNSNDVLSDKVKEALDKAAQDFTTATEKIYQEVLGAGVAKECARVFLPEGFTMSRLYVNGTLRSWLHYLSVRDDPGVTQQEHVLLAREIRKVLEPAFPEVFNAIE